MKPARDGLFAILTKEFNGFADRHVQYIVDIFPMIAHIKDVAFEAMAVARLTFQYEIGHELHFNRDDTGSLTFFATASVGIEREILRAEVHLLGQWLLRE